MRTCGCMRHACCCSDVHNARCRCRGLACPRALPTPSLQPLLCLHRRRSLSLSAIGLPEKIVCILAVCIRPHRAGAMPHLPGRTGTVLTGALEGMLESSPHAYQSRNAGRAARRVRQSWSRQVAALGGTERMFRPTPGQSSGPMRIASHGQGASAGLLYADGCGAAPSLAAKECTGKPQVVSCIVWQQQVGREAVLRKAWSLGGPSLVSESKVAQSV